MNGKAARDKGIRFERAVAIWMGTVTTRSVRPGIHDDGGDVVLPGHIVECKDHLRARVPKWWREVTGKVEGTNLEPVLIVKVPRRRVEGALVYGRDPHTGEMCDPITLEEWWPHD